MERDIQGSIRVLTKLENIRLESNYERMDSDYNDKHRFISMFTSSKTINLHKTATFTIPRSNPHGYNMRNSSLLHKAISLVAKNVLTQPLKRVNFEQ